MFISFICHSVSLFWHRDLEEHALLVLRSYNPGLPDVWPYLCLMPENQTQGGRLWSAVALPQLWRAEGSPH